MAYAFSYGKGMDNRCGCDIMDAPDRAYPLPGGKGEFAIMKSSLLFIALLIMSLIVLSGVAAVVVIIIIMTRRNSREQKTAVRAEVVSKYMGVFSGDTVHRTRHHVIFRTENGEDHDFAVNMTEYDALAEGMRGQLTYQGTWFMGFVKDE